MVRRDDEVYNIEEEMRRNGTCEKLPCSKNKVTAW